MLAAFTPAQSTSSSLSAQNFAASASGTSSGSPPVYVPSLNSDDTGRALMSPVASSEAGWTFSLPSAIPVAAPVPSPSPHPVSATTMAAATAIPRTPALILIPPVALPVDMIINLSGPQVVRRSSR